MKYFVMLNNHQGIPTPMVGSNSDDDSDEEVRLFDSFRQAETSAENNMLGAACGYEVYEWRY